MKKSSISLALLIALSLNACKDDGEDGTQGVDAPDSVSGKMVLAV
jgi:hypothetical protein